MFEDALDLLLGQVNAIGLGQAAPGGMGVADLVASFRDDTTSNMAVMLLRLVTSAEVQRRADFFLPFILVRVGCVWGAFVCFSVLVLFFLGFGARGAARRSFLPTHKKISIKHKK